MYPPSLPQPAPVTPPRTPSPEKSTGVITTALAGLLADHHLCDVTLVSSDGTTFPAVRALLAVRSDFFRNLLFGTFQESRQQRVELHIPATALRQVLTFIYTDACEPLTQSPDPETKRPRTDNARILAQLLVAADYLAVAPLVRAATDAIVHLLEAHPPAACTVLQHVPTSLRANDLALEVVRRDPRLALGVPDRPVADQFQAPVTLPVAELSPDSFTQVLKDPDIFASESYLFKVLQAWADFDSSPERLGQARKLSSHIDLERLKPSFLRDVVRASGLVEEKRIQHTFEQQALEAERGRALFDNFRGGSIFSNGTKFLRATDSGFRNHTLGPSLREGRHEWTFRVHMNSDFLWFGFTSSTPHRGRIFFQQEHSWARNTLGRSYATARQPSSYGSRISTGQTFKIALNLLKSGTVTISVDGSHDVSTAFQGLKSVAKRFIPAICMTAPAHIELIEERHHIG